MATSLARFADYYSSNPYYSYSSNDPTGNFLSFVCAVIVVVSLWKIFVKAKQPGWAAIVPFYNAYLLLRVVNRPGWWFFLYLIPFVNFVIWIIVNNDLAKSFGKGTGTTLLLIFLPFIGYPMLAFGDAKYKAIKRV